jgi:threonine/homoserine/homoserine lactone efflux protein
LISGIWNVLQISVLADTMAVFLIAGIILGLSAGFSPGPLLTLVLSQTLKHGVKEGIKVAFAPLVTDLPIILLAIFVLTRLAGFKAVLGSISLLGGLFVVYLAYESLGTDRLNMDVQEVRRQSLSKGAIINALNPNPYLFWLGVGGPTMVRAWQKSSLSAVAFVAGFYMCLVGSKIILALLVGKSKQLLRGNAYRTLMRVLGILLLVFAFLLFRDALYLLGLLH